MHYFGGKNLIAKHLAKFMESFRQEGQLFVEPFLGGCNILPLMSYPKIGCDLHPQLISLYQHLQRGWTPPDFVSEEQYNEYKALKNSSLDPMVGFCGFGVSFAGKYFAGYCRDKKGASVENNGNYAKRAKNSLAQKIQKCHDALFLNISYQDLNPHNALVYCDPPYADTTKYSTGKFDVELFWNTVRRWSENNIVFVSEYKAPDDFTAVWQKEIKLAVRSKDGCEPRTEKLFCYTPLWERIKDLKRLDVSEVNLFNQPK